MNAERDPPLLGISLREQPANMQAEQAVLGALLHNNRCFDRVCQFLRPEHFAYPAHGQIYTSIARRIIGGHVADAVTLKSEYEHTEVLAEVGGAPYLAMLLSAMVGIINAGEYGVAIYQAWQRRELIDIGETLVNESFAAQLDPGEMVATITSRMDGVTAIGQDRAPSSMNEAMDAVLRAAEEAAKHPGPVGISTGMPSVDDVLGGLEPGTLTILAGRPGMGKTALALGWAISAARSGNSVYVVSLEMSAKALARRALASAADTSVSAIRRGKLQNWQAERLLQARREMDGLPLTIEDNGGLTPAMIALKARTWRRKRGMKLLVLDHLHIVRPETADVRAGATWAVGQVAQSLQMLAKDLDVPVLALAQLNRSVETRDDHRPTKADLRQAGDIEQCADAVAFVYRPEYYLGKAEPERRAQENEGAYRARVEEWHERKRELAGKAELIFDKVRDGAEAVVPLRWHADTMRFSEYGT